MKRTLSLVLALVMLLGTIPVFAADTADEKIAFLVEEGLLKGNTAGDLMLDVELKREDSVVVLARLLGLEEAAVAWETAPTWTDLPENPYYTSVLGWAQEAGYYEGKPGNVFGFGESITANDFALVLLRALGYAEVGDDSWETAFETAEELGLLEGVEAEKADKLLRSNMALMMFAALGTEMAEGGKTLAEELGVVMPEVEMSVAATGAKKLTVTFNKAVTGATFAVAKGSVTVNIDGTPVMAEDGKSATITLVNTLTRGDYTVSVTGVAEEVLKATVTVEDVKVSAINVLSTKAPMNAAYTNATFQFEVLNQYGERMPNVTVNWTASTGYSAPTTTVTNGTGSVTITAPGASGSTFIPGTKVYLTGVFTGNGTVVNTEIEIVLPSHVDGLVFKGVEKGGRFVSLPSNFSSADNYKLLFVAVDQYGNEMATLGATTTDSKTYYNDLVFVSSNPGFILSDFQALNGTVSGVEYLGVKLQPGNLATSGGTATIQAISSKTGKISTYTIEANAMPALRTFTMNAPTALVAAGDAPVQIPFTALDQFGNTLTKATDVNATLIDLSAGLSFASQPDGTTKLMYAVPATANADTPVYLTSVVKSGGNFSSVNFTLRETKMPATVLSLRSTVLTNVAMGNTISIKGSDVLVQDQYGRTMNTSSGTFVTPGAIRVTTTSGGAFNITTSGASIQSTTPPAAVIDLTGANSEIIFTPTSSATSTLRVTFEILKADGTVVSGSGRNVTLTKVAQSSFVSYEVENPGLVYASVDYAKEFNVYGVLANGSKVLLPYNLVDVSSPYVDYVDGELVVITSAGLSLTDTATGLPKNDTKKIIVTIEDEVSAATAAIKEVEITFSGVAPKATTFTLDSLKVVNNSAIVQATSNGSMYVIETGTMTGLVTRVWSQYGDILNITPTSITITDLVKVDSTSGFTVQNNMKDDARIVNPKTGDKFKATFTYAGGATVVIDFTVGVPTN